jgi:hypothetical protein
MILDIGLFPRQAARVLAAVGDVMPEVAGLTRPALERGILLAVDPVGILTSANVWPSRMRVAGEKR